MSDKNTKIKLACAMVGVVAAFLAARTVMKKKQAESKQPKSLPHEESSGKKEANLLHYVQTHAVKGDAKSVLETMDEFVAENPSMIVGQAKGRILDAIFVKRSPKVVVELGGYCGYSALRMALLLNPGGHIYSIEQNVVFASIATKIIEHAGMQDKITIINNTTTNAIPSLKLKYAIHHIDFLFVDHWKEQYVPDMELVEACDLLVPGSIVVADNILRPGAPEYRRWMEINSRFDSQLLTVQLSDDKQDALLVSKKRAL